MITALPVKAAGGAGGYSWGTLLDYGLSLTVSIAVDAGRAKGIFYDP